MQRQIKLGISLVCLLIFIFAIYFVSSAPPANMASKTNGPGEFTQTDPNEPAPPPEPKYDIASLPSIDVDQKVEFGTGKDNRALISGWSVPEPGGIWSLGKNAAIGFLVRCKPTACISDDLMLVFEGSAFVAPGHLSQRIEAWLGKRKVDRVRLSTPYGGMFWISLKGVQIEDGTPLVVSLSFPDAVPSKVTNSTDAREVAFRIASLRLEM
jgi:hypothetical protein